MISQQKPITEPGRSQRMELLTTLKRSAAGMSVKELAVQFGMSYMGVKQHCLLLERDGYVDTRRRSKGVGRPELVYQLTVRAHELFQNRRGSGGAPDRLTVELLEAVNQTYGHNAPAKLLFSMYQRRGNEYASQLNAVGPDPLDRAAALASLRDGEGYMAVLETDSARYARPAPKPASEPDDEPAPGGELAEDEPDDPHESSQAQPAASDSGAQPPTYIRIVEHQSPVEELLRRYPILARLERELFERALGCAVRREDASTAEYYRCLFHIE